MPIQLDKILADIAEEKSLHPNYPNATKKQMDDAWMRVGKKNKLSVHECRSIFKVLQKKYEQERARDTSAWKLFKVMDEIHKKVEVKQEIKNEGESEIPIEEDEEYEMLEVQEDEEQNANSSYSVSSAANATVSGAVTDGDISNKTMKTCTATVSPPEKDEKPFIRNLTGLPPTASQEERKILNTASVATSKIAVGGNSQTSSAVIHKKGVTVKKNLSSGGTNITKIGVVNQNISKTPPVRNSNNSLLEVGRTIQLPDSIKRKLSEDHPSSNAKRQNISQALTTSAPSTSQPQSSSVASHNNSTLETSTLSAQIKQEQDDEKFNVQTQSAQGINIITIPANPSRNDITNANTTATSVTSTPMNGYSPRLEEIDFRNDIIFDSGINGTNTNGVQQHQQNLHRINHTSEIINLGNFDNSLPPTFFKNLCNSSRHEALGLYVANVMNRLNGRAAAKLELGILRAIIEVQSSEIDQ